MSDQDQNLDTQLDTDSNQEKNSKKKTKVLLIDDDTFLRDMYVKKFTDEGFVIEGFDGVDGALDGLKGGFKPDILLTDLIMPTKTGWDFLKAVRDENLAPNAITVVLSNESTDNTDEQRKENYVDGYIVKSMATPSEVVKTVAEIYLSKK